MPGINREGAETGGGAIQRVIGIVDRVRPGVRQTECESIRLCFQKLNLKGIVKAALYLDRGLPNRWGRDNIAVLIDDSSVKRGTADDSSRIAGLTDTCGDAVCDLRRDERGIRRSSIQTPNDAGAVIPDVTAGSVRRDYASARGGR